MQLNKKRKREVIQFPKEIVWLFSVKERGVFIGFRAKDEVIYSRVNGSTKREFDKQMSESGYKNSSDFMDCLLRVNKGKQVDGVTLKEFTDVMKEIAYELKKQGVNINQMARYINQYPDLATASSFQFYERAYMVLCQDLVQVKMRNFSPILTCQKLSLRMCSFVYPFKFIW